MSGPQIDCRLLRGVSKKEEYTYLEATSEVRYVVMEIYTQPVPGYVTELGVVRTFLEYGHIVFGLFVAAIVLALWIMHRRKNYAAMIALSVALCAFSFEAYFPAAYNIKAFILGYAFFELTKCSIINKKRIKNG